jgi:hypothetical protein
VVESTLTAYTLVSWTEPLHRNFLEVSLCNWMSAKLKEQIQVNKIVSLLIRNRKKTEFITCDAPNRILRFQTSHS